MQIKEQWKGSRNWKLVMGVATAATLGLGAMAVATPAADVAPQSINLRDRTVVTDDRSVTTGGSFVPMAEFSQDVSWQSDIPVSMDDSFDQLDSVDYSLDQLDSVDPVDYSLDQLDSVDSVDDSLDQVDSVDPVDDSLYQLDSVDSVDDSIDPVDDSDNSLDSPDDSD